MKILLLGLFAVSLLWANPPETKQEADHRLLEARKREQAAKLQIQSAEQELALLREKLEQARLAQKGVEEGLYASVGITRAQADTVYRQMAQLSSQVTAFSSQYGQVPKDFETAVVWAEYQLKQLGKSPAVKLPTGDSLWSQASGIVQAARSELDALKKSLLPPPEMVEEPQPQPTVAAEPEPEFKPEPQMEPKEERKAEPKVEPKVEPKAEAKPVVQKTSEPKPQPERIVTGSSYVVGQAGDGSDLTLWDIATLVYGDPSLWQRIWRANYKQIQDPDRIEAGLELVIPQGSVPRPW